MSDLTKMKWSQCFFKKKFRVDKKSEIEKATGNDSEDDIHTCDEKQLDDLLYKFSEEIFYDEESKEKLLKMDVIQKRILIRSSRQKFQSSFELLEAILDRLRRLSVEEEVEDQETDKLFDQLSAALRTESLRYVRHFMDGNGLGLIFVYMRDCAVHALNSQIFSQCIRCIRSLGNSENGYDYLLAFRPDKQHQETEPGLIEVIGKGLWSKNGVTVSMICELFGALCFTEEGWLRVMKALLFLARNDVHHRFDILVQQFIFQENLDVKCAVLSLINALAELVQDHQDAIANRVHLRYQTVKCGLVTFITPYTDCCHNALRKQIEVFIQHQKEDIDFLRSKGRLRVSDTFMVKSVDNWEELVDFIGMIGSSLSCTDAQSHLISLLHHMLLLPLAEDTGFLYLQLLDRLVQQISIQRSITENPDPGLTGIQISIDQLLNGLVTDNEMKNKQTEVDNLVVEQNSLREKIVELENQCFVIDSERNKLQAMNTSRAAQLEIYASQSDKLTSDNVDLQNQLSQLRQKLELSCNGVSVIPEVVVHAPPSAPAPSHALLPPPPPPPPPPPSAPPLLPPFTSLPNMPKVALPPPPPPPLNSVSQPSVTAASTPNKPIPKVTSLKCFNWTKVPQAKLTNSVWDNVNENEIYSVIDLEKLQTKFSTVVIEHATKPQSTPTMVHKSITATNHPANVITHQRSQNLFIKLKPARMTWPKWQKHLYECRIGVECELEPFPYQLAEGILGLYPTLEEIELLEDAVTNHGSDNLPEAETFMFECYKFPHYLERLSSLIFLCKAPEHIKRLTTELTTVQMAVQEVMTCHLLPKLLEIVLAVGNVMNQKRGITYGFKIESLNQLKRLKCSQTGSDGVNNLLQFVIMVTETHNPEILDLPKRLECVQSMAKVNVSNIVKDVHDISCGIQKLSNAIDLIRRSSREPCEEDRFLDVACTLQLSITNEFTKLNYLHKSIKSDIEKCHQFFGENAPTASSESEDSTQKLFAELALFLSDMDAAWRFIQNDRERKVLLEQKRSTIKSIGPKPNIGVRKGELDVNISRLLSGDAFKENRLFMARQTQQQSQDIEFN